MSHFHGGFWIPRLSADIVAPVFDATLDYFETKALSPEGMSLAFTARDGASVVHVAVRGGEADGKGYCYWNVEHAALGGLFAKALGCEVWAYGYEDQIGSESLVHFDSQGTVLSSADEGWDDFAERLKISSDDEALWSELPLGKLAERLGLQRPDLTTLFPYDTPSASLGLEGSDDMDSVAEYFESGLVPLGDEVREGETLRELFFPRWMVSEIQTTAQRLGLRCGETVSLAWQLAIPTLYSQPGSDGSPALPAPAVQLRGDLDLSSPPLAVQSTPGPQDGDKAALVLALPRACAAQIQELAVHLDRANSYVAQLAWKQAREKIFSASRTTTPVAPAESFISRFLNFQETTWRDVEQCARTLNLRPERLLSIAWDLSKRQIAAFPAPDEKARAPDLSAPSTVEELHIPDLAEIAPILKADPPRSISIDVSLPARVAAEVTAISQHLDRSDSWTLAQAWTLARGRLHASRRAGT